MHWRAANNNLLHGVRFCQAAAVLLIVLGIVCSSQAQIETTTAALSGRVTDSTGAVVPGATVILSSTEKGISRTVNTNADGNYSFAQLPPSTYTLQISKGGFESYQQVGIVLDSAQAALQNVTLPVGHETQQIVVNANSAILNTENANVSTNLDAKQIVELPLNLRNVFGLATLNSSVSNNTELQAALGGQTLSGDNADQDISFLNFAGGFFGTTAFLLDGVWDTEPFFGAVIYVPSADSVQEFRVQNNSFTAQYGWSTGNVAHVTTKSGTNTFHGDAWSFYRNSALDANLWFNNYNGNPKLPYNRNQTGVVAGGPLYIPKLYKQRDKTFVFGVYEHLGLSSPSTQTFTVPDANFRAGDFSQLLGPQVGIDALGRPIISGQIYNPFTSRAITAGQVDPKTGLVANQTGYIRDPIRNNNVAQLGPLNALGTKLLGYYPNPTASALVNNFYASGTSPAESNEYSLRVDHNLTDATRLYVRYSYKREYKTQSAEFFGPNNPAGPGNIRPNNRYNIVSGFTHIFGPTFTMNLLAGYSYWNQVSTNQSKGFLPSTLGLPTHLDQYNPEFPITAIGSQSTLGPTQGAENAAIPPTLSASSDFTKLYGNHAVSFGFMFVNTEENSKGFPQATLDFNGIFTQGPNPDNPTGNTGNGAAQALLGVLDGGSSAIGYNPAITKRYFGWYVQDDYKPMAKLTLNLGVRYEFQAAPTYRHNAASSFNPQATNPVGSSVGSSLPGALQFLSGNNRGVYDIIHTNFAPRIGFTYQALPNVVVRGGYGIFFPPSVYTIFGPGSTDGFSATTNVVPSLDGRTPNPAVTTSNPWPNGFVQPTGSSLGELQDVGYSVSSTFRQRLSPYVQQYMLGLQYGFTKNDVLDVSFIANHGTHLWFGTFNRSQLLPSYLPLGTSVLDNLVANPFYGHVSAGQSSCNLDQPIIQYAHLLQPYPQYCGVTEYYPTVGFDIYNSLQATYTHRLHSGLSLLVSYTYSKFLDNTDGAESWSYVGNNSPANNYNLAAEKSVDGGDTPHSLVATYIYDIPIGRGKALGANMNRAANAVIGGWEISGIATFKSGIPLAVLGNNINSYGGAPRPDLIGNPKIAHRTIHEWINTGAFAYAPYGTFGTAPRYFSYLRAPSYQNFDTAISKNFFFYRETRFQFRAELFNTFNHTQFYAPNTQFTGCDPNATAGCSSGFGQITHAFPSREVQIAGKFYW